MNFEEVYFDLDLETLENEFIDFQVNFIIMAFLECHGHYMCPHEYTCIPGIYCLCSYFYAYK